jgi:hypothetical protein
MSILATPMVYGYRPSQKRLIAVLSGFRAKMMYPLQSDIKPREGPLTDF